MKIQCDVCDKVEASVFCPSDEAALCHICDRTIHHANKLASKHARFSLVHPNSKDFPLCDICQEKRAYLFCQEDRAILCRECDLPIHRVNEHTQKHNRFLLTGVKLSGTCLDPDSSSTNGPDHSRSKANRPRSVSVSNENASSSCKVEDNMASDTGSVSTSSISEYWIEAIPGYCVEDFLDASFTPNGFCKDQDLIVSMCLFETYSPFQDLDLLVSMCLFPLVTWVPQSSQPSSPTPSSLPQIGSVVGVKENPTANTFKGNSKWRDYGCTVPETCTSFIRKSRHSQ